MNKDINVIKTLTYDEVPNSYKWENEKFKNTFPPSLWVSVLIDFLYKDITTTKLEAMYTQFMPKVNKKSNNMYVNSLLRKMQIKSKQDVNKIKFYYSKDELEKWVVNRINTITEKHYRNAVSQAEKVINDWRIYYRATYVDKNSSYDESVMLQIKQAQSNQTKNKWQKHKLVTSVRKINEIKSWIAESQDVQEWGKRYFYDELTNKFGVKNVIHNKNISNNKNNAYDFLVINNGKKHYYEVRSTKRNTHKFCLDRNEYEFWKQCKQNNDDYSLISIRSLYYYKFSSLPIIAEIKNPQFKINLNEYGYKDGQILITPYQFIGEI